LTSPVPSQEIPGTLPTTKTPNPTLKISEYEIRRQPQKTDSNKQMKVFLHYEDIGDTSLHKSLKLTLPKSWKTGPSSNLLTQFVESYNAKFQESNPLNEKSMHLCIRQASDQSDRTKLFPLCSDDVVVDEIPDRGDVYICHGPSISKSEKLAKEKSLQEERERLLKETVACTHFGCRNRFKKGGPYPDCQYHTLPPVFHETAKYWVSWKKRRTIVFFSTLPFHSPISFSTCCKRHAVLIKR
jgi:hypothetical protein